MVDFSYGFLWKFTRPGRFSTWIYPMLPVCNMVMLRFQSYPIAMGWLIYGYYMVIIWFMMVNDNLVGGWPTPLKNDGQLVTVGMTKFPTEWENNPNVPVTTNQFMFKIPSETEIFLGSGGLCSQPIAGMSPLCCPGVNDWNTQPGSGTMVAMVAVRSFDNLPISMDWFKGKFTGKPHI